MLNSLLSTLIKSHVVFKVVSTQELQLEDFSFFIVFDNIIAVRNKGLTTQRPLNFFQEFNPEK